MIVYTIGHSNRTLDELVEMLRARSIRTLADIRRFPGSRRNPHFSRDSLSISIPELGVDYVHIEELGGHRKALPDSVHEGLRNSSFRAYADHMMSDEFRRGIEKLSGLTGPVAVMCAEAVPWRCHRNLLSDWLVHHGHSVVHLTSTSVGREHEPLALSKLEDGQIVYPAEPPSQGSLPFDTIDG